MEKIIPNTEGRYSITEQGIVKNLISGRIIQPYANMPKSIGINLQASSSSPFRFVTIKTLMKLAFNLTPPDEFHLYIMTNKDGDLWNNDISNLDWKISLLSKENFFYPQPFYNNDGVIISKICQKCGENQDISQFSLQTHRKNHRCTYKNQCLACITKKSWIRIKATPEKLKKATERSKAYLKSDAGQLFIKNYRKKYWVKPKEALNDRYIKHLLTRSLGYALPPSEIPQELVELKRKELLLKKQIANGKKED